MPFFARIFRPRFLDSEAVHGIHFLSILRGRCVNRLIHPSKIVQIQESCLQRDAINFLPIGLPKMVDRCAQFKYQRVCAVHHSIEAFQHRPLVFIHSFIQLSMRFPQISSECLATPNRGNSRINSRPKINK